MTGPLERLSKVMSQRGLCSRREADDYIAKGLVFVNGKRVSVLGTKVDPNADIRLDSKAQKTQDQSVTILLHKPVGFVSNLPEPPYRPAVELITPENQDSEDHVGFLKNEHFKGLAVCGRLDIDSRGLLVFSQDGRIAKKLIGDFSDIEKEYIVGVGGDVTTEKIKLLCYGIELDGQPLRPAKVEVVQPQLLRFILKQGKKRQIRRMCEAVDLQVRSLKRVRIGRIKLGPLPEGQWRFLGPHEHF